MDEYFKDAEDYQDYIDMEYLDEEDEIFGYKCLCCGNIQETDDWGGQCERCIACALEPLYY